jgi:predicted metalloprotease
MLRAMKWQRGHRSKNVEDRRGQKARGRAAKVGGGAALLGLVIVLIGQALGIDLSGLSGGGGSSSQPEPQEESRPRVETAEEKELVEFVHFVIDDIQGTFAKELEKKGKTYRPATLVLFTDAVDSRCGTTSAAVGPFYCPPDYKAYIDLSFYRVLRERLGAGGDFAQAYVLAHEIGHHVQNLLRIDGDSVKQELQADCFAGVWASATSQRKLLDQGDIEESVNAAAQIGDDRLQEMAGQKVNPETWTHGSSEQRVRWFKRGLEAGDLDACDTFKAAEL